MLKAEFFILNDGKIKGFDISGHSGYAESGKDIVCAAVSSAAYMVANTITEVLNKVRITVCGKEFALQTEESAGYMRLLVHDKYLSDCGYILQGFKNHLLMLEEMYSKNIKVFYKEV